MSISGGYKQGEMIVIVADSSRDSHTELMGILTLRHGTTVLHSSRHIAKDKGMDMISKIVCYPTENDSRNLRNEIRRKQRLIKNYRRMSTGLVIYTRYYKKMGHQRSAARRLAALNVRLILDTYPPSENVGTERSLEVALLRWEANTLEIERKLLERYGVSDPKKELVIEQIKKLRTAADEYEKKIHH